MILSIVVPVYNVAQYLPKCLDSLLNQDIDKEDYEIIVVNDGSTDDSGIIAQDYANRYSNIILINQDNQGLSGARNTGIKAAKGKYIQFVDSDDYLEPNVEKALVEKMERENLDILRFNYQNVNEQYQVFSPNKYPKFGADYSDIVTNGLTFLNERLGYECYAVQFIFKAKLVKAQSLFKEGIYFEDTEWTPRIIVAAKRISSIDTIAYNYLVRQGSITKSVTKEKQKKLLEDSIGIIVNMKAQMAGKDDVRWYEGMIAATVTSVMGRIAECPFVEMFRYINRLKQLNIFPISSYNLNKGAKHKRKIINFSPFLFCLLFRLKN